MSLARVQPASGSRLTGRTVGDVLLFKIQEGGQHDGKALPKHLVSMVEAGDAIRARVRSHILSTPGRGASYKSQRWQGPSRPDRGR